MIKRSSEFGLWDVLTLVHEAGRASVFYCAFHFCLAIYGVMGSVGA